MPLQSFDVDVHPLSAVPLAGSVEVRVMSGRVRVLGYDISSSNGEQWHALHSPAGGLGAALQLPSAVCSSARVVIRRIASQPALDDPTLRMAGKRKRRSREGQAKAKTRHTAVADLHAPADAVEEDVDPLDLGEDDDDADGVIEFEDTQLDGADDFVASDGWRGPAVSAPAAAAGRSDSSAPECAPELRLLRAWAHEARLGSLIPSEWAAAVQTLATEMSRPAADATLHALSTRGGAPDVHSTPGEAAGTGAAAPAIVLLCGGRNAGKSSFGRLLLNRVLCESSGGQVGWLDSDVGQSELGPPGLVAWHEVDAPLLGPPHTHLRPPRAARFVGAATPADEPQAYVRSVAALVAEARASPSPLIINTCGWVSGLGARLLDDILATAAPTHIVIFESSGAATARVQLPETLSASTTILRLPTLPGLSTPHVASGPPTVSSPEAAPPTSDAGSGSGLSAPHASESRALQLLAYLGALPLGARALPGDAVGYQHPAWQASIRQLLARPPYAVPLSALECVAIQPSGGAQHARHSAHELATALNASLVGLLIPPPSQPARDGAVASAVLPYSWAECDCVGLGLVRSVDAEAGLLFLHTPVAPQRLQQVRVLVRTSLDVPLALLQPTALTPASPFLAADTLRAAGGDRMRSRNNLQRGPAVTARK